jgi:hypothetical protein
VYGGEQTPESAADAGQLSQGHGRAQARVLIVVMLMVPGI